eukprot:gene19232-32782_t
MPRIVSEGSLANGASITARADDDDALLVVSPVVMSSIAGTHSGGGGDDDDVDIVPETPPPYADTAAGQQQQQQQHQSGSDGLDDDTLLQVRDAQAINMGATSLNAAAPRAPSDPFFAEPGQAQVTPSSSTFTATTTSAPSPSASFSSPPPAAYSDAYAAAAGAAAAAAPAPASASSALPEAGGLAQQQISRPLTFAGGVLPEDFLRVMVPVEVPIDAGPAYGRGGHGSGGGGMGGMYGTGSGDPMMLGMGAGYAEGTVTIHVTQARLAKNYGFTSMDPTVHLTIGGLQARTAVCPNGAKTPYWNQRLVFPGIPAQEQRLKVEIFDIGTFSDTLVAWGNVDITAAMAGDAAMEEWWPLNGKQGTGKEGVIHMHISFKNEGIAEAAAAGMMGGQYGGAAVPDMSQFFAPVVPTRTFPQRPPQQHHHHPQQPPQQQQQQHPQQQQQPPADVSQLKDMFPDMDEDILREVLASKQGNPEAAINTLLAMC